MANRYWVGGTGTWDTTSTTNWSASSGGASGASVPTAADAVFFDQAATYTVTMTGALTCLDITVSAGTVTFATGTTPTLAVSGSMTLLAGTVWSATGAITFNATTTGKTVTTAGTTINATMNFNGVGGGWTLGSALTLGGGAGAVALVAGTLDTSASNYAISAASLTYSGAATAVLNLNASAVSLSGTAPVNFAVGAFTLNAGTSTITCSASNVFTFNGGNQTFYNASFTSTAGGSVSTSISNVNTFNNFAVTSPASAGIRIVSFNASQTINGTFTGSGSAITQRIAYYASPVGTPITLTLANATALSNCDFRDITAAGNAITATNGGNCGGNTNISGFAAGKTVYWNLTGAQAWSATAWATSSGGAPALGNFPLAQDTAVFDNAGAATTVTLSVQYNVSTLNMSARTSAMTLSVTGVMSIYGNLLNGSGITHSGTGAFNFLGRGGTQQITSSGVSFTEGITVNNPGTTVQLQDALTTSGTTTLTWGTLDLNGKALTTAIFSSSNTLARTLAFGAGSITVTGTGTVWTTSTATNLSVTGTPVVNVTNATATATTVTTGALSEANSISFNFTAGTYALTFLNAANSAARNVNFTGFAGTWNATNAATIYGNLTLSAGMTLTFATNAMTFGGTTGTQTITTSGKTIDFSLTFNGLGGTFQFADALTMGSTRALTITNGTLKLLAGSTNTVGSFATGAGTTQRFLQSTAAGSQATITDPSGVNAATYLTIQDIVATGGATWNAFTANGNADGGNNIGWDFGVSPSYAYEFPIELRSFTERKHF